MDIMNEIIYLIAYDINEQQYDYSDLKEKIMSYGDYQHPMETMWFIRVGSEVTANDISNSLKEHLHSAHDHIYVMQVLDSVPRQGWLPKAFWKWLKQ